MEIVKQKRVWWLVEQCSETAVTEWFCDDGHVEGRGRLWQYTMYYLSKERVTVGRDRER